MASTTNPSGLSIVRSGNLKFCLSWKIADKNYDAGQSLRWRTWKDSKNISKWTTVTLSASATSKTITLSAGSYYPATKTHIVKFEFEVCGRKSGADWSAWSNKSIELKAPAKPTVSAALTNTNQTTFTYSADIGTDDNKPFYCYEYQTVVLKDCKAYDGSKVNWWKSNVGWDTGSPTSATPKAITENVTLSGNSYTRWFRVRTRGAAGDSAWAYAKHVYAKPYTPKIKSVKSTVRSGNTNIVLTWVAASDASHPIDETVAQYCIATPRSNLNIPATPTWTDAATMVDTPAEDTTNFLVSSQVSTDECFFVRVVNKHDTSANDSPSSFSIADYGRLATPSNLSVTLDSSYKASISVDNNSSVPDSKVAIVWRGKDGKEITIGVTGTGSGTQTLSNKQCPNTTSAPKFYAYAFQGTATAKSRKDGVSSYAVVANMQSGNVYDSASAPEVPVPPENFTVTKSGSDAVLEWDIGWDNAVGTLISWSTDKNAWSSTNEPNTYTINSKTAQKWRVANLESGHVWYFRARFIGKVNGEERLSPWSDRETLDLTAVPDTPVLNLSKAIVRPGGSIKASWSYSSPDGTKQASAEVKRTDNNNVILRTTTKKNGTFTIPASWTQDTTYNLAVRVTSNTGKVSDWSDPVPFYYGPAMTCTLSSYTNIANATVTDSDGNTRTAFTMDELPASVTVTGADAGETTTLIIERAEAYHVERPDGSMRDGYMGETIFLARQLGDDPISINQNDLIGMLDDSATYRIIATVEDANGQSARRTRLFEVHWDHQPTVPNAQVTIQDGVAVITASATGTVAGDTVDIYRLSTDNPQLIVQGGSFGTAYVDPYPALGENAGYRVVYVSKYGDYITASNQFAWTDEAINLDNAVGYIHFNGEVISLQFNVELSGSWSKDFKQTRYLNGTIRGDWNAGVARSWSVNVTIPTDYTDRIQQMRRLADYTGICHVRTQDGSSFPADVQVTASTGYSVGGHVENYTLNITRIAPQALDGIPYSEWINQ